MKNSIEQHIIASRELDLLIDAAEGRIDFTLESAMSYSEFFSVLGKAIRDTFKSIFNVHTTAEMLSPAQPGQLTRIIEERGINSMRSTLVYRLPKQTASMLELVTTLDSQVIELSEIMDRLYKPAYKWVAGVVTESDLAEENWIDRNIKFKDVAPMVDAQAELFKPTGKRNESSEFIEFIAMFPTTADFNKVHIAVTRAYETLAQVDLDELVKMEKRLVENIDRLIRKSNSPDEEFVMPQATKIMLAKVFRAMAVETEYLVATVFQLNTAIGAWNNTVEKLKKDYM